MLSDDWSVLSSPAFKEFIDWLLTDNHSFTCQYAELTTLAAGLLAGGSALSSITGSLFGAKAGKDAQAAANAANLQATRETNQQNYQLYQEQKAFDREMWQNQLDLYDKMWSQQTEYNSPKEQVKRLEEAGLNPTLMMSNLDTGQVQTPYSPSAPTSPSAPQMQAPRVEAYDPTNAYISAGLSVGSSLNSMVSNLYVGEQTKNVALQNITQLQRDIADLENKKTLTDSEKTRLDLLRETFNDQVQAYRLNNKQISENILTQREQRKFIKLEQESKRLANEYQTLLNHIQEQLGPRQVALLNEQIKTQMAETDLHRSGAALNFANKSLAAAQEKGVNIDNKTKSLLRNSLVKQAKAAAKLQTWEADNPVVSRVIPGIASGLGGIIGGFLGTKGAMLGNAGRAVVKGFGM